jgi:hypothetical protein
MTALFSQRFSRIALLILLLAGACSAPRVLISKSAAVPAGVDLNGMWLLRRESDDRRPANYGGRQEGLVLGSKKKSGRKMRSLGGSSVPVFLEYGRSLKITQTQYGIFISYDRSIVEEYTFGENRPVEVGPIEATRVSGWEGASFVVETLDDSGTMLFETWHLDEEGSVLIRDIRIAKDEENQFVQQQIFDRV